MRAEDWGREAERRREIRAKGDKGRMGRQYEVRLPGTCEAGSGKEVVKFLFHPAGLLRKPAALLRNERKRTEEDGSLEARPEPEPRTRPTEECGRLYDFLATHGDWRSGALEWPGEKI